MQLTDLPAILDEIRDRIVDALPTVAKVHYGRPYAAQTSYPYVVVSLRPVRFEAHTLRQEAQYLEFEIVYRGVKPSSGNLLLTKVALFDSLATALVTSTQFSILANYGTPPGGPAISEADFSESEPDAEAESREYEFSFVLNLTSYKDLA